MKKIIIVYDDRNIVNKELQEIVGYRTYGEIIYRKKTLQEYFVELFNLTYNNIDLHISVIKASDKINSIPFGNLYIYFRSNYIVFNKEKFINIIDKLPFMDESYKINAGIYIFNNITQLNNLLNQNKNELNTIDMLHNFDNINDIFLDIQYLENFMILLSSGLDTRFFNQLSGSKYTITKKSSNIKKIFNEYNYYRLIPDYMKIWFVMPYEYKEENEYASYKMERIHATDLALKYVHNSIKSDELISILNKIFYFINTREYKKVPETVYSEYKDNIYNIKVMQRIQMLKETDIYPKIALYLENIKSIGNIKYNNLDDIFNHYLSLYKKISKKDNLLKLVIGHGDLCFSNILYNYSTNYMKFIDTKGAGDIEELYTNPYYDLAKLSHSICGLYDFFNADLFTININQQLKINLSLVYDNTYFKNIFKQVLEENGYDYIVTRLYEASLFLSMLPLHVDYPKKVLGFILNAVNILNEVETCLKN